MAPLLTAADFQPHRDKLFRVRGAAHALRLVRIDERRLEEWEAAMGLREPFNLIFRGPPGDVLPEGLYRLEVENGPGFELYVMPIHTPGRDRQDYQAAFN